MKINFCEYWSAYQLNRNVFLNLKNSHHDNEELEEYEFEPFFAELLPQLKGKIVGIFGSYAWNQGDWIVTWKQRLNDAGVELISEPVKAYSYPDDEALAACAALGKAVANA